MAPWTPPSAAVLERDAVVFVEGRLYFCALAAPPPPRTPIQRVPVAPGRPTTLFVRSDRRADRRYAYRPFFSDFGPPDLGAVFRFCEEVDALLGLAAASGERVVHCVANTPAARANGAFLSAAYAVLRLSRSAREAFGPLMGMYPPLVPFRDASYGLCTHTVSILDCLNALVRATRPSDMASQGGASAAAATAAAAAGTGTGTGTGTGAGTAAAAPAPGANAPQRTGHHPAQILVPAKFDPQSYAHYDLVENGDWNWIVADKLLAFSGPHDVRRTCVPRKQALVYVDVQQHLDRAQQAQSNMAPAGQRGPHRQEQQLLQQQQQQLEQQSPSSSHREMLCASDYAELLRMHGVTDVVRLNSPSHYARETFTANGFRHHELYFSDGSVPSARIVERFLHIMATAQGAVAVHCKAGLGRTGTLACCYVMRQYGLTAREAMAWVRIARPGSVVGPQQHYLERIEAQIRRARLDDEARKDISQWRHTQQMQQQRQQQRQHQQQRLFQRQQRARQAGNGVGPQARYGSQSAPSLAALSGARGRQQPQQYQQPQRQRVVRAKFGERRGQLREFVPIVGPTLGNTSAQFVGGASQHQLRQQAGRPKTTSASTRRERGRGAFRVKSMVRSDRDVNGMCRGRPTGLPSGWNPKIVKVGPHSHGSRRGPRPEAETLPGVASRAKVTLRR